MPYTAPSRELEDFKPDSVAILCDGDPVGLTAAAIGSMGLEYSTYQF